MKELLLDSNVLLRFVLLDDPKQSAAATNIFAAAAQGHCRLRVDSLIIAECIYVLVGHFQRDRRIVAQALSSILQSVGIDSNEKGLLLDALRRFSGTRVDFQDAWLASQSAETKASVASFDRDLDKFTDATRFEPGRDSL